ncbi:MAG: tetratricopeptide repeat protein [bacterium]
MSLWSRFFRSSVGEQYQRGIKFFNEGDYDQAVRCLEEVVAGDRSRESPIAKLSAFYAAEARSKLGIAEFHRGNYDRALEHFESALKVNPHYPDLYYYLGVVYHKRNDLERSVENLKHATDLHPNYAEATCYLGIVLHEAGFFEQADACFSRALALSRESPNPLSHLLVDKIESKCFEHPVLRELKQAVVENSNFETKVREGHRCFNRGDFESAVECFEQALAFQPSYADLHCKLGLCYLELGKPERAAECFANALEQNPTYTEAHYSLGITLYRLKRYDESCERLRSATELEPDYADLHCRLGVAEMSLGNYHAAKCSIERALEISPGYARANYMLGLLLHQFGFPAEFDRGTQRLGAGDWREAAASFKRLIAKNPDHADARCLLGTACLNSGETEEAERQLAMALEINPNYVEAMKQLALLHFRMERYDKAKRLIERALELHQDYADLHKILGDICLAHGELPAAARSYENALAANPDFADAAHGLVICLRREGKGDESDRVLGAFLERHPADAAARLLVTDDRMELEPDQ